MMRQIRKQILTIGLLFLAFWPGFAQVSPVLAASVVTTAIVSNPLTGVALDGNDPVSYFTEKEPLQGTVDLAYDWGGVTWYFANKANLDVFKADPEVYAPQFGGYCAMGVARGFLSDGNPRVYTMVGQRLYLFYSTANRDAFLLSPKKAMTDAVGHWAELSKDLSTN